MLDIPIIGRRKSVVTDGEVLSLLIVSYLIGKPVFILLELNMSCFMVYFLIQLLNCNAVMGAQDTRKSLMVLKLFYFYLLLVWSCTST